MKLPIELVLKIFYFLPFIDVLNIATSKSPVLRSLITSTFLKQWLKYHNGSAIAFHHSQRNPERQIHVPLMEKLKNIHKSMVTARDIGLIDGTHIVVNYLTKKVESEPFTRVNYRKTALIINLVQYLRNQHTQFYILILEDAIMHRTAPKRKKATLPQLNLVHNILMRFINYVQIYDFDFLLSEIVAMLDVSDHILKFLELHRQERGSNKFEVFNIE